MQKRSSENRSFVDDTITFEGDVPICCLDPTVMDDKTPLILHRHNCLEIGYCYEGRGVFMVGDRLFQFKTGDISIIGPAQYHLGRSQIDTYSVWNFVYFDEWFFRANKLALRPDVLRTCVAPRVWPGVIHSAEDKQLCRVVFEILDELGSRRAHWQEVVTGLLIAALGKLDRRTGGLPLTKESPDITTMDVIAPALSYIIENYSSEIRVSELAELCCVSEVHFRRLFAAAMGQSPLDYITSVRLNMATVMLKHTAYSITEIAERAGFAEMSSFYRQFTKAHRMSPRQWRSTHWEEVVNQESRTAAFSSFDGPR